MRRYRDEQIQAARQKWDLDFHSNWYLIDLNDFGLSTEHHRDYLE
jgi:hypothetical protein